MADLILGTAGHIDHGKTSLIRALTGVNTDRLPEEKQRGITIDLGFAELDLPPHRLGIVDVPGHEKFVRNMLAGATGMDVALLVVAADDSVKPQTREHFEILRMLALPAGVIAITKCDLVDSDWLPLVEEEIRELVADSFLAQAPMVPVSSATGDGLDTLREQLKVAADKAAAARTTNEQAPFRMAIDRCFTLAGHGTVVTGSISSGKVAVGDQLAIEPGGQTVRVRSLHNHDRGTDTLHRGQRAAINLGGIHHQEVTRGQELATAGHLRPTNVLTVRLQLLPELHRPVKHRQRLRVHLGSSEQQASLRLLGDDNLLAGQSGWAQLWLAQPVVAVWHQPFVIRSESPVTTLGGGVIGSPDVSQIRRPTERQLQMIAQLLSDDADQRAEASLYLAGWQGWHPDDLARSAGIVDVSDQTQRLAEAGQLTTIELTAARSLHLHRLVLEELGEQIAEVLRRRHEADPLAVGFPRQRIAQRFDFLPSTEVFRRALQQQVAAKQIESHGDTLTLAGYGPRLSKNERRLLDELIAWCRESGFETPTVAELKAKTSKNRDSVESLLKIAVAQGSLVEVSPQYFLHAEVDLAIQRQIIEALQERPAGLTLSDIRDIVSSSRKYAVPYSEYLDRIGFTRRQGDLRVLQQPTG